MNDWQVESFCALDSHRTAVKTSQLVRRKTLFSFKILIHEQAVRLSSLLFTKEKKNRSIILSHFSNLKFLFGLINYLYLL